ncbi:NAD(P)/FAD-dependent oxidoreductase [Accumulibacter sp.]|uniref:NAD(P)/FAD-dependent oxidoreductase n=1 Tax=Accumulibacter sp. TaxID=2053492 RepID=UPI0025CC74DD|nr:FAD-dependent oxidoreductase [Accumulibacter sp.]MCM8594177.1 FAD-dependent oxidoreductase [Accumulibacter sp.]MCM8625739.1 FAD-dependent oxidoreductase [Accumulibacter sp.]MDS4048320.1 FAD-dependent oxidoreductase [Accumulibacter sp.]
MSRAPGQRIAVIGAGISGLASAWLLSRRHLVTVYEAAAHAGGHTNTVDVEVDGIRHPVDTGFLVYNTKTYPQLTALFAHLGVASSETEMSFSVSIEDAGVEWAGSNLATIFGQKRNLVRRDFWRMLADILRFNREAGAWLDRNPDSSLTLRAFLDRGGYSRSFVEWYLLPMAAAIWSCPAGQMLDYPLASFVRFCRNHGLLQIFDRPLWRTVVGGGREYVRRLTTHLDDLRLATPVRRVQRSADGLSVITDGAVETYDQVVLACHSDQSLVILGDSATADERRLLSAIRYAPNRAVLHTDPALLPRSPALWSAWNYLSAAGELDQRPVSVSYLINRLQALPFRTPVIVSLNPQREPDQERIIAGFEYAHPVFDGPAIAAQQELAGISGVAGVWFCGAWNGYGFHEDGLRSALRVANALGCHAPWQLGVPDSDGGRVALHRVGASAR